ncbi:hypothetical protein ACLOJK_002422 [Asimina triloba]
MLCPYRILTVRWAGPTNKNLLFVIGQSMDGPHFTIHIQSGQTNSTDGSNDDFSPGSLYRIIRFSFLPPPTVGKGAGGKPSFSQERVIPRAKQRSGRAKATRNSEIARGTFLKRGSGYQAWRQTSCHIRPKAKSRGSTRGNTKAKEGFI